LITTFSLWFSLAGRNGFYLFEEPQAKNGFVARVATRRGLSKDRPEVTSLDGTKPGFDVSGETANRNPIDLPRTRRRASTGERWTSRSIIYAGTDVQTSS
jgi:hypothetical protein